MSEKRKNLPAIIISAVAVAVIAGLCIFGILTINSKNRELEELQANLEKSEDDLKETKGKLSEVTAAYDSNLKTLEQKTEELETSEKEKEEIGKLEKEEELAKEKGCRVI